jgi:hypothetical protein
MPLSWCSCKFRKQQVHSRVTFNVITNLVMEPPACRMPLCWSSWQLRGVVLQARIQQLHGQQRRSEFAGLSHTAMLVQLA